MFPSSVVEIARRNRLLEALPVNAQESIQPHLTPVLLSPGQVLQDCDRDIYWIYFPTSAQISLVVVMTNGSAIESSLVGDEGVVGIELPLGMRRPACRAVVHIAGGALRLNAEILLSELPRNLELQRLTLYYAQRLMAQLFQTAACNRLHSVEQQLCRWLLHRLDRAPGNDLSLTQEFVANMLGDRRETISVAEGHLQRRGLIRHSRGRIIVLDRRGLETLACECYSRLRGRAQPLLQMMNAGATESLLAEPSEHQAGPSIPPRSRVSHI